MEKKGRNPHFGYTYISEAQLAHEIGQRLAKRNIWFATSVLSSEVRYSEIKGAGIFVHVNVECTFRDGDTGDEVSVRGAGLGWDTGDKGMYKAITGAVKYVLMKNFLISDEQDPESDDKPAEKPGAQGHRRTREYEHETGAGDKRVETDLLELKAFLTEHKIPDGFLLRLLQDKKLIDGHTKNVAQLKPGVLRRCLDDKSKNNLIKAWAAQQADEASGSATTPENESDEPDLGQRPRGEVRTREGDQTRRGTREPVDAGTDPADLLEQEGYDNWREVAIHFGQHEGKVLGKLPQKSLAWWIENYETKAYKSTWNDKDLLLDAALVLASRELGGANGD